MRCSYLYSCMIDINSIVRLQSVSIFSSCPPGAEVESSSFMCVEMKAGNVAVTLEVKVREDHQLLVQSGHPYDISRLYGTFWTKGITGLAMPCMGNNCQLCDLM